MKLHTETPYTVKDYADFSAIENSDGEIIAKCRDRETARAIVTACNNHDRLVEALEHILFLHDNLVLGVGDGGFRENTIKLAGKVLVKIMKDGE